MAKTKIIDPENLSAEDQRLVKAGHPLIVIKSENEKTGKLEGKDGRIIWDGECFIFVPERVKI